MVVPKYKTVMEENKQNVLVREDEYQLEEDCVLDRPVKICEFVCDFLHMDELAEEYIYVIGMDTRLKPVGISEVGHGSVDACLSSMRSIMMRLLLMGASKYVLVHNHPSGGCNTQQGGHPDDEDGGPSRRTDGYSLGRSYRDRGQSLCCAWRHRERERQEDGRAQRVWIYRYLAASKLTMKNLFCIIKENETEGAVQDTRLNFQKLKERKVSKCVRSCKKWKTKVE